MSAPTTSRWLLPGLVLLNLVLKGLWLGVNEMAHDEPFTVYWSQRSLAELWAMMRTENNPPLYFLLIKGWSALVPFETAWLRVPSAVFSALTVWPLYLLARSLSGTRAALTCCLLFTFTNYHYGFAHEVRAYSLFALLAVLGMWLIVRSKYKLHQGWNSALALALVDILLVYTHFFGWLLVGIQLLTVLFLPEFERQRRMVLTGLALCLLAYLPYAAIFLARFGQSVSQGTWLEAPVPEELYNMIWRWSNRPVLAVLFLVTILVAAWRTKLSDLGLRLGLLWAFAPLLGMFMASFVAPIFLDRYLVYAAPGFALLVAASISTAVPNERITVALSVGACMGMLASFTPWQDTGLHPSRVVAQAEAWCGQRCNLRVLPEWYWLNYNAAENIVYLRDPMPDHLPVDGSHARGEYVRGVPMSTVVVVDAGSSVQDPQRSWYQKLRADHVTVDSILADHKVWVYRFQR